MNFRQQPPVAILGTGIGGLTAARELRRSGIPVELYEAGPHVGGLATSFTDDEGFTYDLGAHFITNRLAKEVGIAEHCRDVRYYGESVLIKGRTYTYPLGLMTAPRYLTSALISHISPGPRKSNTAADWFRRMYGKALADEIAIPLLEEWSGAPASDLAASVGDKIPVGILRVLLLRAASRIMNKAVAIGYGRELPESIRVWHVYPELGLKMISERMASELSSHIHLNTPVEAIVVKENRTVAVRVKGREQEVSAVISTIPCSALPKLLQGTRALDYLSRFKFRPMVFVMMRFLGRNLLKDAVLWTPEQQFPFFRLTETPISMPWLAPAGKTLVTVDLGCEVGDQIWSMTEDQAGEFCLESLTPIIKDARQRYLGCRTLRTPIAYPIFLSEYEEARKQFQQCTGIEFLYSIGRNGEFEHLLTEDVYWRTLRKLPQIMTDLRNRPVDARVDQSSVAAS